MCLNAKYGFRLVHWQRLNAESASSHLPTRTGPIMPLLALGINYKTAPIELRERVAFAPDRVPSALMALVEGGAAKEAAILSTCNRTEIYCGQADDHQMLSWLSDYHELTPKQLEPFIYRHPDRQAVHHMLRVASGLDSLVLGEPQILGQVKSAYQTANAAGTLGACLERLFQHTFAVAKQVRTDTEIGANPVSVAFAAVSLAKQIFAQPKDQTALLIGAGETIELVARYLHDFGVKRLIIANRTYERAHHLAAKLGGYAIGLHELEAHLGEVDLIISSTASPNYLVTAPQMAKARKGQRHRPMLIVDIAVPRDVDPQVAELNDIYLYTVDDLAHIVEENRRHRAAAAAAAEDIVELQTDRFMEWLRQREGATTLAQLRKQADQMRDEVLLRALRQLQNGKSPEAVLEVLAHNLTNKLTHGPCKTLREAFAQGDDDTVALIKSMYSLDKSL